VTNPLHLRRPEAGPDRFLLAEAGKDFLAACVLDGRGGFLPPRLGLACVYLYEGDDAKAQDALHEMRVGVADPGYQNVQGVLEEHAGDADAAQRGYAKALGLSAEAEPAQLVAELATVPHPYLPALYNLARLFENRGNTAEAAACYRAFLGREGSRSAFGVRARDGLLRCGGQLPKQPAQAVIDSLHGVEVGASPLVVTTEFGSPGSRRKLSVGREAVALYSYPALGVRVLLTSGPGGDSVTAFIGLAAPSREEVGGVHIGDPAAVLVSRLGQPREVVAEPGGVTWHDYSRYGVVFQVAQGKVRQCLIGGRP